MTTQQKLGAFLMILAVLWGYSCAKEEPAAGQHSSSGETLSTAPTVKAVSELPDLSAEVSRCVMLSRDTSKEIKDFVGVPGAYVDTNSPGDEQILSVRELPDGTWWKVTDVLPYIAAYASATGDYPTSGEELLNQQVSAAAQGRIAAITPDKQLVQYARFINPFTGRFFESFDRSHWEPGGVFIEPLSNVEGNRWSDGTESGSVGFADNDANGTPVPDLHVQGAFRYGVFGDQPGEILFEDYGTFTCPDCPK